MTPKHIIKELDMQMKRTEDIKRNHPSLYSVRTLKEYLALPESERFDKNLWIKWYIAPHSLIMDELDFSGKELDSNSLGWAGFNYWARKNFPIQYFIRKGWHDLSFIKAFHRWKYSMAWKLERLKYRIQWFFGPARPNLIKSVGRHYRDLPEIMRDFNFECIIEYVEGEEGLKHAKLQLRKPRKGSNEHEIEWHNSTIKENREFYYGLKKCYQYIKTERPKLVKDEEEALNKWYDEYNNETNKKKNVRGGRYWLSNKIEKQRDDKDKKMLVWIAQNTNKFWT